LSAVCLRPEEYEAVLDVVRAVSSARDPVEFARLTVEQVALLIPADVVTLNHVDPVARDVIYAAEPESFVIPPDTGESLARLADEHPIIRYAAETGDGSARRISDFLSREEFHESELYERVYKPMGIEYQVAVTLTAPSPTVVGIAASRAAHDFSDRERAVFETARPHLTQAWRIAAEQRHLQGLLGAATDALAERGSGVIVLWESPQELVPGALASIRRFFGPPSRQGRLPVRIERWVGSERARLHLGGPLALAHPLAARQGNRRLVLHYLPAQAEHPGAILLREGARAISTRRLETLRLSTREAEIVRLAVTGSTNDEIAERLTIASGTVKKHLDNVYAKLGLSGRLQLSAFVHDMLGA
jgi:DNA-binding CsgD family transcriptional regulator